VQWRSQERRVEPLCGKYDVTFMRILQKLYFIILFSTFRLILNAFIIDELLLQNNYFNRNMHKNALFLLKNCKNRSAIRDLLPRSLAAGGLFKRVSVEIGQNVCLLCPWTRHLTGFPLSLSG